MLLLGLCFLGTTISVSKIDPSRGSVLRCKTWQNTLEEAELAGCEDEGRGRLVLQEPSSVATRRSLVLSYSFWGAHTGFLGVLVIVDI